MEESLLLPCTAFDGNRCLASGPLVEVALAVKNAETAGAKGPLQTFDDATARVIDLDLRGSKQEVIARLPETIARMARVEPPAPETERGGQRGRPRLGVVGREVTLLPRHWDWLNAQPGGASVALRKLVDQARRDSGDKDRRRTASEAAYRFMSAMAGNLPGYEDAIRALFADDRKVFAERVAPWPADIRDYAVKLAFAADQPAASVPASSSLPS
jgi:uncharacterized protein